MHKEIIEGSNYLVNMTKFRQSRFTITRPHQVCCYYQLVGGHLHSVEWFSNEFQCHSLYTCIHTYHAHKSMEKFWILITDIAFGMGPGIEERALLSCIVCIFI